LINNEIIIELKACETLIEEHEIQVVNYLKATKMEVGLLLNFEKTSEIKRKIYSNEFKKMNKKH
jgi:GxxExxY protein